MAPVLFLLSSVFERQEVSVSAYHVRNEVLIEFTFFHTAVYDG